MVLQIPLPIWQQMWSYANYCLPHEVTGIGTLEQLNNQTLRVTEIFLPYQHTNPGYSEFDEGELGNIITDLIATQPERVTDLRFRWHSHGLGQTFWSSTDEKDIASWESSWVANLVINAKGGHLARFDLFEPFRISNIPLTVEIDYRTDDALAAKYREDVASKVKVMPIDQNMPFDPRKRPLGGIFGYERL